MRRLSASSQLRRPPPTTTEGQVQSSTPKILEKDVNCQSLDNICGAGRINGRAAGGIVSLSAPELPYFDSNGTGKGETGPPWGGPADSHTRGVLANSPEPWGMRYQADLARIDLIWRRVIESARRLPRCHGRAVVSRAAVSMMDLIQRCFLVMSALLPSLPLVRDIVLDP